MRLALMLALMLPLMLIAVACVFITAMFDDDDHFKGA